MDQDQITDTPASDDQSRRRSFGGLGRGPAALLLAAGLLIGGGVSGFIVANAASPAVPSPMPTGGAAHHCPNMGGTKAA